MTTHEFDWPVRLKNTNAKPISKEDLPMHYAAAGFGALAFVICGVASLWTGEWGPIQFWFFMVGLSGIAGGLIYFICKFIPQDYVLLYPDRMEFPGEMKKYRVIRWSDVKYICWPSDRNTAGHIWLRMANDKWFSLPRKINWRSVGIEDRVTLIRYLRVQGKNVEQKNWPHFCHRGALPLAKTILKKEDDQRHPAELHFSRQIEKSNRLLEKQPFLAGIYMPFVIAYGLIGSVSRKLWWSMAAIITVSTVVNMRLVWGCWNVYITSVMLGFATAMAFCGLFAVESVSDVKYTWRTYIPFIFWTSIFLIGMPFLSSMAIQHRFQGEWLLYVFFLLWLGMCFHLFILGVRSKRSAKGEQEARWEETERRWTVFEATGDLPDPAE